MEPNPLADENHSIVSVRVPRMIPRPRLGGLTRPVGAALAAPPLGGFRSTHERHTPALSSHDTDASDERAAPVSRRCPVEALLLQAGPSKKASPRSTIEMIGPPFVTRRQLQQLPPCAGEATLVGQLAEPVRHFSIVRPVHRQGAVPLLVHA